jgi:serine/threonine protein kinase/tetratricopeptide (TPR) repeat protein
LERLSEQDQERLTAVLDGYLRGLECGMPPQPEQLVDAHPDLAEPLRAYLGKLTSLHEVAATFGQSSKAATAASDVPDADARRLGDFELLAEVGRGGMGVVYEARQLSLERRVALKVLPFAAVLDAQQIARFKNEAQAAAQVHHPNIVPVFAIGSERGVHYYAMQFIDGAPLDRVIRALRGRAQRDEPPCGNPAASRVAETRVADGPTLVDGLARGSVLCEKWTSRPDYFRVVTLLGIQAADALHAAHAYGVVHRDIKPSNLLVDADGKLWITDFGLARCQRDLTLTRTGDVIGTEQYMSPEQALGKAALVDHRTDIYSLGATLYELVTLRPAFSAPDGTTLRRRIDQQEPARPRSLDPRIPVDLETVVLKAMARDREERYLTAQELADDLRRVLEGRPTVARPPTLGDRMVKFARRHRRMALAAAAVSLVVILGLGTSAVLVNRARANAQRDFERAERHFRDATEAVDRFGSQLAERLADVPGAQQVRRELLGQTLAYYERFVSQAAEDPGLRADLATTYGKIGALYDQMGSTEEAIRAHRQAIALWQQSAGRGATPDDQRRLAASHNNLALALRRAGRSRESRSALDRAIELQTALAMAHPDRALYLVDLAGSYNNLGLLDSETARASEARASFREAIRLQEEAANTGGDAGAMWRGLAASYNNLAALAGDDKQQAIELHRKAADYQARAAQARPNDSQLKSGWALALNNLGAAQARADQPADALASYRRAIELGKELLRVEPLDRGFRRDLSVSYNNLGLAYSRLRQADNAQRSFRNALGFAQQLADENPNDIESASSLGGVYNNLGIVLEEVGRLDEAAASYQKAVDYQRSVQAKAASVERYRVFLSKHYYNLGRVQRRLGRASDATATALARKRLWPGDPARLLSVAEELALASGVGGGDPGAATADRSAELAIGTLREAVAAGLRVPADLDRKESFAALRGRKEFESLVHP